MEVVTRCIDGIDGVGNVDRMAKGGVEGESFSVVICAQY